MTPLISQANQALQNSLNFGEAADISLKGILLLAAAAGVCLGWRRSSASARHLVWFLALAGLLCLPLLTRLLPASRDPLWTVGQQRVSGNELALIFGFAPSKDASASHAATVDRPDIVQDTKTNRTEPTTVARFGIHWSLWIFRVWLLGAIGILGSLCHGHLRLHFIQFRERPPANREWQTLTDRLGKELGINRPITLLQASGDTMPVTWGWWKPVIVLPTQANAWTAERLRVVLLHELAHVKRGDYLTQLVAGVACAIYWFNPLAWVAAGRMRVEREAACDDLVINTGCRASDYASHLLDLARGLRCHSHPTAVAMARSANLRSRINALVDPSRARRKPRTLLVVACGLGFVLYMASCSSSGTSPGRSTVVAVKPWYDARLRRFFADKEVHARQLAKRDAQPVPDEVWPYFAAGSRGDWATATNLWSAMRRRAGQYEGTTPDPNLYKVWSPILETDLAWEDFAHWDEKHLLAFGNDIIQSIPLGSIYFGGTDPGRGLITAFSESHANGKPFYTLTQNALADSTYVAYLQATYGSMIHIPSEADTSKAFAEYVADTKQRLAENKLRPGEQARDYGDGRFEVGGQVAVMSINALIVKTIFDRNPGHEFYIEESYPLDWTYPHLTPHGLIMKIERQPLPNLPDELVQRDFAYWSQHLQPYVGSWPNEGTSTSELVAWVEKIYLRHDFHGFKGDPKYIADAWAQRAFSKMRSAIAGIYAWRASHAATPADRRRMLDAADLAFRQAYFLGPTSTDTLSRYKAFLEETGRAAEGQALAELNSKLEPGNSAIGRMTTGPN